MAFSLTFYRNFVSNDWWDLLQAKKGVTVVVFVCVCTICMCVCERDVSSSNLLCLFECASAPHHSPTPPPPLRRSRPYPLVRRPLRLPCFDRCSLCPNASQRTLWRLSHAPLSLFLSLSYSFPSLCLPNFRSCIASNYNPISRMSCFLILLYLLLKLH